MPLPSSLGPSVPEPSKRGGVRYVRCLDCGHVGNRAFAQDDEGRWRDVLGGSLGVCPENCVCTYCDGERFEMVEEAPDASP